MAELLSHRYNFRLQGTASPLLSRRPFGWVPGEEIELELWPWLEKPRIRTYEHWVWWTGRRQNTKDIQRGFRHDTGRLTSSSSHYPEMVCVDEALVCEEELDLEPSFKATLRMVSDYMNDVAGDRDMGISTMPNAKEHPWLEDWMGFNWCRAIFLCGVVATEQMFLFFFPNSFLLLK